MSVSDNPKQPSARRLGQDESGTWWQVQVANSEALVKYFEHGLSEAIRNKWQALIHEDPTPALKRQTTWPLEWVAGDQGQEGVLMRDQQGIWLSDYLEEGRPLNQRIEVAKALCLLVSEFHRNNYLLGDMNPDGFLVDQLGQQTHLTYARLERISFLDRQGNTWATPSGRYDLLAPELRGINLSQLPYVAWTRENDYYQLAVLIFVLLVDQVHPLTGLDFRREVSQANPQPSPGYHELDFRVEDYPQLLEFPSQLVSLMDFSFRVGLDNPTQRLLPQTWYQSLEALEESLESGSDRKASGLDPASELLDEDQSSSGHNRLGRLVFSLVLLMGLAGGAWATWDYMTTSGNQKASFSQSQSVQESLAEETVIPYALDKEWDQVLHDLQEGQLDESSLEAGFQAIDREAFDPYPVVKQMLADLDQEGNPEALFDLYSHTYTYQLRRGTLSSLEGQAINYLRAKLLLGLDQAGISKAILAKTYQNYLDINETSPDLGEVLRRLSDYSGQDGRAYQVEFGLVDDQPSQIAVMLYSPVSGRSYDYIYRLEDSQWTAFSPEGEPMESQAFDFEETYGAQLTDTYQPQVIFPEGTIFQKFEADSSTSSQSS
ncbi:hypothetical protein [Hutsoniella sourekii]|uniref:hypothetical protein n=1 Tax=Hutsoniella sourekii TaxID=87650 RepID=UPI00048A1115|nr:hypothetical protein [Hutsoniella sourekii]